VKRSRGRGRRPQNSHSHNRAFDSAGPDVKIRGTAAHVYEKYLQLARDANSAGDRIQAENYLQHAEHYYRILMAAQVHQAGQQPGFNPNQPQGGPQEQRPNGGEPYAQQPGGSGPSFALPDEGDDGDEGEEAA
jgi:hypothetical protein